jgi:hypothetical protein
VPVILATQEAEIRRIAVRSQLGQTVPQNLISKNPSQKRAVEWLKVKALRSTTQYLKKKKEHITLKAVQWGNKIKRNKENLVTIENEKK